MLLIATLLSSVFSCAQQAPATEMWRAWLDSPGGELPFQLELQRQDTPDAATDWQAWIHNGSERIEIPKVTWHEESRLLVMEMAHYESRLQATVSIDGQAMDGRWTKRRGLNKWADMGFHARHHGETAPRFMRPAPATEESSEQAAPYAKLAQRFWMRFSSSKDLAVGAFQEQDSGAVEGTILTTLGDYRFLAGYRQQDEWKLSCFDGAHAFLFLASATEQGWEGQFFSGDSWVESWQARADAEAKLPNSFDEIALAAGIDPQAPLDLKGYRFPNLNGEVQSLADPALHGKATIISLFGSWCPNCNDEAALWAELHEAYGEKGLRIIGLGFELTEDQDRDLQQLQRFRDRWKLKHPLFLAGSANKQEAQKAFPLLAQVKSFPTAIFLDHTGRVRAIHSGFSGPATGDAHLRLRERYTSLIEELLAEANKVDADQTW
jgi:thiol-disulfide isomerase/thioredoxin